MKFADQEAVDLAKPEFEGLWDHHKPYKVPRDVDQSPLKLPGASKMDKVCTGRVESCRILFLIKFFYLDYSKLRS